MIDQGPPEAIGRNEKMGVTPKATLVVSTDAGKPSFMPRSRKVSASEASTSIAAWFLLPEPEPGKPPPLTVHNFGSDTLWKFRAGR